MRAKNLRLDSMDKDSTPLRKLMLQFEASNPSEGKTPKTIQWYRTGLGLFLDYLRAQGVEPVLRIVDIR